MLKKLMHYILHKSEKRIGVKLDYAHGIVDEDIGLFFRYGKIFGFLDPNKNVPAPAYHAARICGAISADCGTCVEAEVNLATYAGLSADLISNILRQNHSNLSSEISAVVKLAVAVTNFQDSPEDREFIVATYGKKGLIELAYAMNGAALVPGIKRAMGYATACNLDVLKMKSAAEPTTADNKPVQPTAKASAD